MRMLHAVCLTSLVILANVNAQEKKPVDPFEKRFTLEFKDAPWREVFEKIADQSGMPYASVYPAPPGRFTYSSPKGKKLSLIEAIDAINDILLDRDKNILIRRDVTLTMFPVDAINEFRIPLVAKPEDLRKHSKHLPVRTKITVNDPEKIAKDIKRLVGEFGRAIALPETNQILIEATPLSQRLVYLLLQNYQTFTFEPGKPRELDNQVRPTDAYSKQLTYGLDLDSKVRLTESGVTSDKPFYFSVLLPEGNYNVTMTFGDPKDATDTTVLAESRRLMLPSVNTAAGKFETRTITVNIRNAQLKNGHVKLKEREINGPVSSPVLHWDDKLTLEFAGKRPCINTIEIIRNDAAITVFLAADSTVTDQTKGDYRGWGQMLPSLFVPGMVAIANHAESGEATTSFLAAKRLDKILQLMKKGDYLFIQFGHNDQNQKRSIDDYTKALNRYVVEARKKEAIPVLVTPIARRNFGPDGKIRNNLGDYPDAVRRLAKDEKVALIDLNALSKEYYESLGPEKSKAAFVAKDNTHTNEVGALELARRAARAILQSELGLAKYLREEK